MTIIVNPNIEIPTTIAKEELPDLENLRRDVHEVMSKNDPSHDATHIHRVISLSQYILKEEQSRTEQQYNSSLIHVAALTHDVFDKKYNPDLSPEKKGLHDLLVRHGWSSDFAEDVNDVVEYVSFSKEISNPEQAEAALRRNPELAIVQDADRLDAIGAVGIGRVFAFGAARMPQRGLCGCIEHFVDKLEILEGMMKTETGRRLAKERTERLRIFRQWWKEEMALV
ncbi:hypothetical protein NA57DRAFT_57989 [Rhizodiscina lignyota]|uniref:HD/PDEase domain-containing protein n=1 Tax=Rhizodiscina lignyota TaxID=1504668 RepID=A0A9P4IE60_9PEZI|nr:hypothetical protein NA57DRAFT_57989 [Rhizodiscina lignyota]